MNLGDIRDFVANPDLVTSSIEYGVESAFSFLVSKSLLDSVENMTVYDVTNIVNGGQSGYSDRLRQFNATTSSS